MGNFAALYQDAPTYIEENKKEEEIEKIDEEDIPEGLFDD